MNNPAAYYNEIDVFKAIWLRANIAHDVMIDAARREFDEVAGVKIIDISSKHLTIFEFEEKVIVVFKKLDRGRVPRNYPTKHAKSLMGGGPRSAWYYPSRNFSCRRLCLESRRDKGCGS